MAYFSSTLIYFIVASLLSLSVSLNVFLSSLSSNLIPLPKFKLNSWALCYYIKQTRYSVHSPLFFGEIADIDCWVWRAAILVSWCAQHWGEYTVHAGRDVEGTAGEKITHWFFCILPSFANSKRPTWWWPIKPNNPHLQSQGSHGKIVDCEKS